MSTTDKSLIDDRHTFGCGAATILLAQSLSHFADLPIAHGATVNRYDCRQFAHRAGAENFIRSIEIFYRQVRFMAGDFLRGANLQNRGAPRPHFA